MANDGSNRSGRRRNSAAIAAALLLSGCLQPAVIDVEDAWVRLPAVPGRPAVGYFTVRGGERPTRLVAVSADLAQRSEMHESMDAGGMATMRPVAALPLPPHGEIVFKPGGRHLMMFGVNPALKPGGTTILSFTFADGARLERKAWAYAASDPAPD